MNTCLCWPVITFTYGLSTDVTTSPAAMDVTVAVRRVNLHETHSLLASSLASGDNRILGFDEKAQAHTRNIGTMGIYVFRKSTLVELPTNNDFLDFGRHVLPAMAAGDYTTAAYQFPGYWANVGTVQSYWEANMSLLAEDPAP
ncbi:MAG: sugar phosphate nucleotidyltransferase [Caldilineaceae bacterium]